MWYRTSITRMDPSGQLNIDYGNEYQTKFDPKRFIDFKYPQLDGVYNIIAYLKGTDIILGSISFYYSNNSVNIESVGIKEYNSEEMQKYISELQNAGYEIDQTSVSRQGWGIGPLLYKELKKYIKNNFPYAKQILGDVHSYDAFKRRNETFGLPDYVADYIDSFITPEMKPEEKRKVVQELEKKFPGTYYDEKGYFNTIGEGLSVRHKI